MSAQRLALLLVLFTASAARAQAGNELEGLLEESIVSTPSKTSESASLAPATMTIITAEQLRMHGITSLDEAINFLSLGMVATNPLHAVEVGARGVLLTADYGNHVLLMVDGHSLNEAWDGTAYFERGAAIPFELIDHIEISLGPGSVMYGSQAMLGVINVVTKRARDYDGVRLVLEGDVTVPTSRTGAIEPSPLSAYGSGYRAAGGVGRSFQLFGEPSEATLQIEYYRQEGPNWEFGPQDSGTDAVTGEPVNWGPRAPRGTWVGTTTDAHYTEVPAAYGRLIIGDLTMALRGGMYERATPYLDGIVQSYGDFDDAGNRERDRFLNGEIKLRSPISSNVVLTSRVYGDINEYTIHNRSSAAQPCPEGLDAGCTRDLTGVGRVLGSELQATLAFPSVHAETLLGLDGRLVNASSDLEVRDLATNEVAPVDNDYEDTEGLIAPYVQQSLSPWDWLDASAGLRLDAYTNFGSKLSPRGALSFSVWTGGTLKLIYAEAFRAPASYEMQYADVSLTVASPELKPESVRSLEASFEQRLGVHRLFFGVFRSLWKDMVSYALLDDGELAAAIDQGTLLEGTTEGYQTRNVGTIDSYGYNAAYEAAVLDRRLRLGANLTGAYTRAHEDDAAPAIPLTVGPSFFGNARVSYAFGAELPTLALAAQYLAKRPVDRAFDGGFAYTPYAPADLELKLAVTGAFPSVPHLRYRLSATYATATRGPYVIGPNQYAADETSRAELSPIRRLHGFLGLQYVIH
jgi:outer membrane receptor for ferrienterochelin and colicins